MAQDSVAVIIPTYNRALLIPAALDSIIAQTYEGPVEAIVIDDGSTDNTSDVVDTYIQGQTTPAGNTSIRYISLSKAGVVTARNIGIAETTAPYVAFLDSDDYWHPDKLAKQVDALSHDPGIGVAHTSFRYVDEQGQFQDDGAQRLENPCNGACLDALLTEDLVVFSSVLMRRSIIEQVAAAEDHGLPFDPRWTNAQDYDLLLRAARLSRFVYLPEPLTYYRLHGAHGAMSNLRRAYGFHSRVQIDFARRYGDEVGLDEDEARRRAAEFIHGRAESAFWKRDFTTVADLCDLARELEIYDERFASLERKASRPRWLYRAKDLLDRSK